LHGTYPCGWDKVDWPRKKALSQILHGYDALILHLSQMEHSDRKEQAAKAKSYLKALRSVGSVCFLLLLDRISTCLTRLSLLFQSNEATVGQILSAIEVAIDELKQMLERY